MSDVGTSRPVFYDEMEVGTMVTGNTIERGALEPLMYTMGVDSNGNSVSLTETNLWKGGKRPCEAKFR